MHMILQSDCKNNDFKNDLSYETHRSQLQLSCAVHEKWLIWKELKKDCDKSKKTGQSLL